MSPHRTGTSPSAASVGDEDVLLGSRALLAVVARSLSGALEEVTLPQFRILVILSGRGPMRSGDLAEVAGVHPSTLSRTAERLVRGGWVDRVTNPDSRRETLLTLTPAGTELVLQVTQRRAQEISGIMRRLSVADRHSVRRAFAAFSRAAGESASSDLLLLGLADETPVPPPS